MLVVSHPTATATELTQPPTSNWVLSSPPHSTELMGKLVSVPSHPNYCCRRTFSLLQQTCSGSRAAPQPGSRHGQGSSSPWGTPAHAALGRKDKDNVCAPEMVAQHPLLPAALRRPVGERRRLFPLGMFCPAKPSAGVAVQP